MDRRSSPEFDQPKGWKMREEVAHVLLRFYGCYGCFLLWYCCDLFLFQLIIHLPLQSTIVVTRNPVPLFLPLRCVGYDVCPTNADADDRKWPQQPPDRAVQLNHGSNWAVIWWRSICGGAYCYMRTRTTPNTKKLYTSPCPSSVLLYFISE